MDTEGGRETSDIKCWSREQNEPGSDRRRSIGPFHKRRGHLEFKNTNVPVHFKLHLTKQIYCKLHPHGSLMARFLLVGSIPSPRGPRMAFRSQTTTERSYI